MKEGTKSIVEIMLKPVREEAVAGCGTTTGPPVLSLGCHIVTEESFVFSISENQYQGASYRCN